MATLAETLTRLFAEKTLVALRRSVAPYHQLASGVFIGFEPSAGVDLETQPKEDFTRSPDRCLNTLVVDYHGPSRWVTIEAEFAWSELVAAREFQVGLYARPDRTMTCRAVLRIPVGGADSEAFDDFTLCELVLTPEGRSAHGQGRLGLALPDSSHESRPPKFLIFFDAGDDFHMAIDYVTTYFA